MAAVPCAVCASTVAPRWCLRRLPQAEADSGAPAAASTSGEGEGSDSTASTSSSEEGSSEEDLVEYEGMLVSVAAAQRRRCVRSLSPVQTRPCPSPFLLLPQNIAPYSALFGGHKLSDSFVAFAKALPQCSDTLCHQPFPIYAWDRYLCFTLGDLCTGSCFPSLPLLLPPHAPLVQGDICTVCTSLCPAGSSAACCSGQPRCTGG